MLTLFFMTGTITASFYFELELFVIEFILFFDKSFIKDKKRILKAGIALLVLILLLLFLPPFINSITSLIWSSIYESLVLLLFFGLVTSVFYFSSGLKINKTVYFAGIAYSLQHLVYSVSYLISSISINGHNIGEGQTLVLCVSLLIEATCSLIIRQRINQIDDKEINRKSLSFIIILVLAVNIILGVVSGKSIESPVLAGYEEENLKNLLIIIEKTYSIVFCIVILYVELSLMRIRDLENKVRFIEFIHEVDKSNYEKRKRDLEETRILYHDLKHIVNDLDGQISKEALSEYKEKIRLIGNYKRTGNSALDVVLSEENKRCSENNIELYYIGSGELISFMDESDVYGLFMNLLDNAFEALLKVTSKDKKIINLNIRKKEQFILITCENVYENKLVKKANSLFASSKENTTSHGYGLESIKRIIEKYNGNLTISSNDNVFKVTILFNEAVDEKGSDKEND